MPLFMTDSGGKSDVGMPGMGGAGMGFGAGPSLDGFESRQNPDGSVDFLIGEGPQDGSMPEFLTPELLEKFEAMIDEARSGGSDDLDPNSLPTRRNSDGSTDYLIGEGPQDGSMPGFLTPELLKEFEAMTGEARSGGSGEFNPNALQTRRNPDGSTDYLIGEGPRDGSRPESLTDALLRRFESLTS